MNQKQLFITGAKLIGVYCIAVALRDLFLVFPKDLVLRSQVYDPDSLFKMYGWTSLLFPLAMAFVGTYLIRDGEYLHHLASHEEEILRPDRSDNFFNTGVMLYGIFLLARAVPDCIGAIGDLIVVLRSPGYVDIDFAKERLQIESLPTAASLGLGLFCLIKTRVFRRLAFRSGSAMGSGGLK